MHLVRKAFAPSQLSVFPLALWGRRSSSSPFPGTLVAAATTHLFGAFGGGIRSHRVPLRTPAWIPGRTLRGGERGGAGGGIRGMGGRMSAGLRFGGEVPLVQTICDELAAITDPEGEAEKGIDSPILSKVLKLMDKLEPEDLGLSEDDFQDLTHPLCMQVFAEDDSFFEMTVFILAKGAELPLHDHPNMAVLSKILFGSLGVDSYDVESDGDFSPNSTSGADADAEVAGEGRRQGWDDIAGGGGGLRRVCVKQPHRIATAAAPSFLLTPSKGNIHAFRALTACAVFDVLVPPYDSPRGRRCSYFRVETSVAVTPQAVANVSGRGDVEGETGVVGEARERVVLREMPEPDGLPQWSRYLGPSVTLRQMF